MRMPLIRAPVGRRFRTGPSSATPAPPLKGGVLLQLRPRPSPGMDADAVGDNRPSGSEMQGARRVLAPTFASVSVRLGSLVLTLQEPFFRLPTNGAITSQRSPSWDLSGGLCARHGDARLRTGANKGSSESSGIRVGVIEHQGLPH